jgi:leucine dehydrogenase
MSRTRREDTLPRLRFRIVAGGADNVLPRPTCRRPGREWGVLYASDSGVNAGGLIFLENHS